MQRIPVVGQKLMKILYLAILLFDVSEFFLVAFSETCKYTDIFFNFL